MQKGVLVGSYSERDDDDQDELLTLAQVARILHLHERTVRVQLLKPGQLPYSRHGLRYLIKRTDLDAFIARHEHRNPGAQRRLNGESTAEDEGGGE